MLGKTKESIIPLSAISSIDTTKEQNLKTLVAAGVFGFFSLIWMTEGSAGVGLLFLLIAGACLLGWWATRSYHLVVRSPTGEISVEGSNSDRDTLESFASYLRNQRQSQRQPTQPATRSGHTA